MYPLSESALSQQAHQIQKSVELAVAKINDDSSFVVDGTKINIKIKEHDTEESQTKAASAIFELQKDGAVAVVGPMASQTASSAALMGTIFKLPLVSYAATSPEFKKTTKYKYFTRASSSDTQRADALCALIKRMNWNRVGFMVSSDSLDGASVFRQLELKAIESDIKILASATHTTCTSTNLAACQENIRKQLNVILEAGARIIFLIDDIDNAKVVLNEAYKSNMLGSHSDGSSFVTHEWIAVSDFMTYELYEQNDLCDATCVENLLEATQGMIGTRTLYNHNTVSETWFTENWNNKVGEADLTDAQKAATGLTNWKGNNMDPRVPYAWDAVTMIVNALQAVCSVDTSNCETNIKDVTLMHEKLLDSDFEGASGHVYFDNPTANSRNGAFEYIFMKKVNDEMNEPEGFGSYLIGPDSDPSQGDTITVTPTAVTWPDGTNQPPPDVDTFELPSITTNIFFVSCGIIFVLVLVFAVFIWINREGAVMYFASPVFLYTCLVSVCLMLVIAMLMTNDQPSDSECLRLMWLQHVTCAMLFAAFFSKYLLVLVVKRFIYLTKFKEYVFLAIIFGFIVIVALLLLLAGSSPISDATVDSTDPSLQYFSCEYDSVFQQIALTLEILVFCASVVMSFARKTPSKFSEMRWVNMALYSVIFVAFLVLPLVHIMHLGALAHVSVQIVGLIVLAAAILVFLSVHKVVRIHMHGTDGMTFCDGDASSEETAKLTAELRQNIERLLRERDSARMALAKIEAALHITSDKYELAKMHLE
eukprot:TRINITY_DN3681_c0_g1_i1.p1 TRINITY_DN3681_c0_g1~~TRINITY_DN3681_c0_g1_i1.p1  ORF type:complete len:802 (-),score=261.94 TRINITY_DN3681_c0_g1_i1:2486-4780(-)